MSFPSSVYIAWVFFGLYMIIIGIYVIVKKNVFGKGETGKSILNALNIGEKGRKTISIVIGFLVIFIGLFFLISALHVL